MKELYIIVNEKIYEKNNFYFCENKDIQSIINYLSLKYNFPKVVVGSKGITANT